MSGITDYAQNKLQDALWRGQALGAPASWYFALITASRGERTNSAAYALNDTIVVKIGAKYAFYKCTTAGAAAAALPGYTGAAGEAVVDGAATFTEQTAALGAGTAVTEVAGGAYARVAVPAALANFAGTQAPGTIVASSGSGGQTSNNGAITFPAPTAQWHPAGGAIVGVAVFDAANGGNCWHWSLMSAPKNVNNGDPGPSLAAGAWTDKLGD